MHNRRRMEMCWGEVVPALCQRTLVYRAANGSGYSVSSWVVHGVERSVGWWLPGDKRMEPMLLSSATTKYGISLARANNSIINLDLL